MVCKRCDADITDPARSFVHRLSERVVLLPGEDVHVRGHESTPSFDGRFLFAELCPSGWAIVVIERHKFYDERDKRWCMISGATRHIRPEHVSRKPGLRARKDREEHSVQ
jgi:hypothetical protein